MKTREFKKKLYKQLAVVTKALSNPTRLEILDLIAQGPVPVEYIAEHIDQPVANASQHLQVLKKSGLVETERKGKYNYYRMAGKQVYDVWNSLRAIGFSRNSEIEDLLNDYRSKKSGLKTISRDELLRKMEEDDVYLIDVRPSEEFELGHIKNAVSLPKVELGERLDELPKDKEVVAYCRGPLCLMADEAVRFLKENGFNAVRLDEGFPEWKAIDLPVD
ncbi:ArsR/SmtB family transcription factor [Gracilimonas amylolytica]|uniref:ArsR/SmtB family transcription factor n=1 Tax=Gracilimonas amylolytica TaxID=1749045 RepID=UPI000CD996CF|nr:metalloregulator ArsR/SmtB family transcription factor [Gracilimonas amylolytica]